MCIQKQLPEQKNIVFPPKLIQRDCRWEELNENMNLSEIWPIQVCRCSFLELHFRCNLLFFICLFISLNSIYSLIYQIFSSIAQNNSCPYNFYNESEYMTSLTIFRPRKGEVFYCKWSHFVKRQIRIEWKYWSVNGVLRLNQPIVYPSKRLHRRCCRGEVT